MKKIFCIALVLMFIMSMPVVSATEGSKDVEIKVVVYNPNDYTNSSMQIYLDGVLVGATLTPIMNFTTTKSITYTYTCPNITCPNVTCPNPTWDTTTLESNITSALQTELAEHNYSVDWNESTLRDITNDVVAHLLADQQAWLKETFMPSRAELDNCTVALGTAEGRIDVLKNRLDDYTRPGGTIDDKDQLIDAYKNERNWLIAISLLFFIGFCATILLVSAPGIKRKLLGGQ